jgi:hypothetical protein
MSNLIEEYGAQWFSSKFGGSYFMYNGMPHIVQNTAEGRKTVECTSLRKQDGIVVPTTARLPNEVFTDISLFSVPQLGWRSTDSGRYLAYYARNNTSYHRGLSSRNIIIAESPLTKWLRMYANYSNTPQEIDKAYISLLPEFLPVTEGVRRMREGEIVSFAASPTIAVVPDIDGKLSVMFKTKKAGTIMPDGSMTFLIPDFTSYMENI